MLDAAAKRIVLTIMVFRPSTFTGPLFFSLKGRVNKMTTPVMKKSSVRNQTCCMLNVIVFSVFCDMER